MMLSAAEIVDDKGIIWPYHSLELRRQLHCLNYPDNFAADMVKGLGFVLIFRGKKRLILELHSETVANAAIWASVQRLADSGNTIVEFRYLDKTSVLSILETGLARAITRLVGLARRKGRATRIQSAPLSPHVLSPNSLLLPFLTRWAEHSDRSLSTDLAKVAETVNVKRYYWSAPINDGSDFLIHALGSGMQVPDNTWPQRAVGSSLVSQPDRPYWKWVADCYRHTLAHTEPALDDVDTDIYWPTFGWVRRRYRRLLLPCNLPDGSTGLFGVSSDEAQVALRRDPL